MLRTAETTRGLVEILKEGVNKFTFYDLQLVQMVLHQDARQFPPRYRNELIRIMWNYLFITRNNLSSMYPRGNSPSRDAKLEPCFGEYCDMVATKILTPKDTYRRLYAMLVYSVSAFSIFVLKQPGCPVGMPFPDGARLEEIDHLYYCPVKPPSRVWDHSLCRFCCAVPQLQASIHR
jgi:uncharacterized protein (UPF0305 family)